MSSATRFVTSKYMLVTYRLHILSKFAFVIGEEEFHSIIFATAASRWQLLMEELKSNPRFP